MRLLGRRGSGPLLCPLPGRLSSCNESWSLQMRACMNIMNYSRQAARTTRLAWAGITTAGKVAGTTVEPAPHRRRQLAATLPADLAAGTSAASSKKANCSSAAWRGRRHAVRMLPPMTMTLTFAGCPSATASDANMRVLVPAPGLEPRPLFVGAGQEAEAAGCVLFLSRARVLCNWVRSNGENQAIALLGSTAFTKPANQGWLPVPPGVHPRRVGLAAARGRGIGAQWTSILHYAPSREMRDMAVEIGWFPANSWPVEAVNG